MSTDDQDISDLKKIHEEREKFHNALRNNNRAVAEKFIEENPRIKIGYNLDKRSSLTIALKAGKNIDDFEMYALLSYHRFGASMDDVDHKRLYGRLSAIQKEAMTLKRSVFYGKPVDSHIFFIYSKTRLGLHYDQDIQTEYFGRIKGYLDKLNGMEEIAPILKVIENSQSLLITFDFDNDSVHKLDLLSTEATEGICYFKTGRIYMGAQSSEAEVLGTLAHELTHYAMQILFNNKCQPFDIVNVNRRKDFEEIVELYRKEYRNQNDHDPIVNRVFQCYPDENVHSAELIVRVPHMIALYNNADQEMKNNVMLKYRRLFQYYTTHVLQPIESFIKDPEKFKRIRDVQQNNDMLGRYQSYKPCFKDDSLLDEKLLNSNSIQLLASNVPELTRAQVVQSLLKKQSFSDIKGSFVLASFKDFTNKFYVQSFYSVVGTIVVNFDKDDKFEENDDLWRMMNDENFRAKFILICHQSQTEMIKSKLDIELDPRNRFTYNWSDLAENIQAELLSMRVLFQGSLLELRELVNPNYSSRMLLPLYELFEKQRIIFGSEISRNHGYNPSYYIERIFYDDTTSRVTNFQRQEKKSERNEKSYNTKEILSIAEEKRLLIIVDDAGKGKSTVLTHMALQIKRNFPNLWVIRVDLHQHDDIFKQEIINVESFVLENFVKPQSDFECQLFKDLYSDMKVVLLLDGFDEIAPFFMNEVLSFLGRLKALSQSRFWITTRPHLKFELEDELDQKSYCLSLFTPADQISFMVKFWKSKPKLSKVDNTKLEKCAETIIEKLRTSLKASESDLIGIPLQTLMVAEIFMDDVKKFVGLSSENGISFDVPNFSNMIWLYRQFVSKKIQIVQSERGRLISKEKADLEVFGVNMISLHEDLANSEIFQKEFSFDIEKDKLQRYGIITFKGDSDKPQFLHRTFAEYFVATHVTKNLPQFDPVVMFKIIFDSYEYKVVVQFIESELQSKEKFFKDEKIHKAIASFIEIKAFEKSADMFFLHRQLYGYHMIMIDFLLTCMHYCSERLNSNILCCIVEGGFNLFMHALIIEQGELALRIWSVATKIFNLNRKYYFLIESDDGLNAFQHIFFTQYQESFEEKPSLKILLDIAVEILDPVELNQLITSFKHRKMEINNAYRKRADGSLKNCLDFKLKIAKQLTNQSDYEIIKEDNLFTSLIRFIIDYEEETDNHILELFRFACENLNSDEAFEAFQSSFYDLSMEKVKNSATKNEIEEIIRNRKSQ